MHPTEEVDPRRVDRNSEGYGGTVATAVRWAGRCLVVASLGLWIGWLAWRVTAPMPSVLGPLVFVLELAAVAVAVVLSAAMWSAAPVAVTSRQRRASRSPSGLLPQTVAVVLGISTPTGRHVGEDRAAPRIGDDDTGEVRWARVGTRSLLGAVRHRDGRPGLAELAWSVVAVEGMRRLITVAVVVAVLLSGRAPFEVPPTSVVVMLLASQVLLTSGHFLLSDGLIRPGARLRWSMASIGAGFGDGTSRTGLPIRWTATLATIVSLNIAVSLRGVSDRWTHGLGAMPHDQRVTVMLGAAWLVVWGFAALRTLPQPQLGYYGATRRLEEPSTRRLALGATLTVAAVGMIAGVLPGPVPA